jgi:hypothetical protein
LENWKQFDGVPNCIHYTYNYNTVKDVEQDILPVLEVMSVYRTGSSAMVSLTVYI